MSDDHPHQPTAAPRSRDSQRQVTRRVLVVEDDLDLSAGIAENLAASGHEVDSVSDGIAALNAARQRTYDLVVLDIMLPDLDGLAICRLLRGEGNSVPILFLTGLGESCDRIAGLEAGADDYLCKPFHLREFLLRVEALLRRSTSGANGSDADAVLRFGGNEIDLRSQVGRSFNGTRHLLDFREIALLKLLAQHHGRTVPREEIVDAVWGWDERPSSRRLEQYVRQLQRRFERSPDAPRHLHNMRPVGYRFTFDAGDST